MYCKNCGQELNNKASFCKGCGSKAGNSIVDTQNKAIKPVEDNQIKFELKPTFKWGYKILTEGLGMIAVILFFTFYIFAGSDIKDAWNFIKSTPIMMAVILLLFITVPMVKIIFTSMQYKKLCYNFYATKVEYIDGFLNRSQKELKYKYVREIVMKEGIIERIFGLGTIQVFTNASTGKYSSETNGMENGILIHCLTDVKSKYAEIKKIVDAATEE